jgi:DNA repair protein RadD
MFKLRDYQQQAVDCTVKHFQKQKNPGVIVLPTGAGKSLVIAELAKIAKGRVLVLAHVKELVEQNHSKYEAYELEAGIYSAGLSRKDKEQKVIFGSIQSVARATDDFFKGFTLLVIDECHRISMDGDTQYSQVIKKLRSDNSDICILGLTATPYRMGMGWIYKYNNRGILRTTESRFFTNCVFDLSLGYMIKNSFLTPPIKIDSPVACYDFSSLKDNGRLFPAKDVENILKDQSRVTPGIIKNIIDIAEDNNRKGIMIFTSSVRHAKEILQYLPEGCSELIVGDTIDFERDLIIKNFKDQIIRYLVNVSVLTTGFDAPHVDLIAILRPTESVSLYQQIVGRGLRLSPDKKDCLILDYTGVGHNIFSPEIGEDRPSEESVAVKISCPVCNYENDFWGIVSPDGETIEHFGRKCQGANQDHSTLVITTCNYRFRFKLCDQCNVENDIAARECNTCKHLLVDSDSKLKEAMSLKDAHVLRPDTMTFEVSVDKKGRERLEVKYYDFDAEYLSEYFYLSTDSEIKAFYFNFTRIHNKLPERKIIIKNLNDVIRQQDRFKTPMFVIGRKKKYYWQIREKIFK